MKVTLISPNQISGIAGKYPNLGIGYLAAVLEKNEIDAQIWDISASSLSNRDLQIKLEREKPDIVGITSNSFTFLHTKKIAQTIKKITPNTKIVIGGPQATLYPRETMFNLEFDVAIHGEAEISLPNLIGNISKENFKDINGISYREGENVIVNPPEKLIKNIDSIPFPARHLMPMKKYFSPIAREVPYHMMITSRGCPFSCTYCAPIGGKKFRVRSPTNVVDEIEELTSEYGIKELQFYDDSFSVKKERVIQICDEIINRGLDFQWDARTRVDIIDEELLRKMKGAGCTRIRYGVEAGDQKVLDIMNKNITPEQVKEAVSLTKKVGGIEILTYFMIGTPGETLETIHKTISLAKELNTDHVRFNITNANPGTQMYKDALMRGVFSEDYWIQYARGELEYIPELFFETEEYTKKDLEKIVKYAYSECQKK
jgi:anaerobic magnesium-protoporphyrin IX monomethyl ester cyclase